MENGFAVAMAAIVVFVIAGAVSNGNDPDAIRALIGGFVKTAFRIAFLLILIQASLEVFGREGLLLRPDWQRFGGFATGLAMLACGGALMASLVPYLLA
jgi:hypothetical protein